MTEDWTDWTRSRERAAFGALIAVLLAPVVAHGLWRPMVHVFGPAGDAGAVTSAAVAIAVAVVLVRCLRPRLAQLLSLGLGGLVAAGASVSLSLGLAGLLTLLSVTAVTGLLAQRLFPRIPPSLDGLARRHKALTALYGVVALVSFVSVARVSIFMGDPTRVDQQVLPGEKFLETHSCLTAYVRADTLSRGGVDNLYESQWWHGAHGLPPRPAGAEDPYRTTMPARAPQESTLQGTSVHRPAADTDAVADMTLALALVWSQDEPARLGEVVCLPRAPVPFTIGRATEPGEDGALPLGLARLRPFSREDTGPLRAGPVSRWQLRVRVLEDDELLVERIGRGELTLNGHPVERATAQTGDLIEVGGRFSLLVTRRPTSWPSGEAWYPSFPFGEADAHGIVGESPAAWELRRRIAFVAPLREHTLVHGPTGAGKELVVAALHRLSPRAARPLIARGAATIPGPLIDAELFGNIRDYPAPGMPERPGLLGEADGGTLFLDDIGELPHAQQAHLLRVMDSGEYQRLGAPRSSAADLRILAATSRAPAELKHDLLARFAHRVRVPGLDERREDLPLLARHLLRRLTQSRPQAQDGELRLSAGLIAALMWHPFSVHVHELIELLWRAIAASPGLEVLAPPDAAEPPPLRPSESYTAPESLTREQVLAALAACDGVREQAWRMLGLRSRDQLKRLLKKLAI